MQFEVKGIPYFLNFIAEEGRWELLTPTREGIQRLTVETDDVPFITLMMDNNEEGKKVVN